MIDVKITGIEETKAKLAAFKAEYPQVIADGIIETTDDLHTALANYAPPRPTAYVRTGDYGEGLITAYSEMQGSVTETTPYSIWLRGDGVGYPQAWMHVGWWESLLDMIPRLKPGFIQTFQNRIDGLIMRIFGR